MRILFDNQPVLAGARFAFIAIAERRTWAWPTASAQRTTSSRSEILRRRARADSILHFIDDGFRRHRERFLNRLIAIELKIAINFGRFALPKRCDTALDFIADWESRLPCPYCVPFFFYSSRIRSDCRFSGGRFS